MARVKLSPFSLALSGKMSNLTFSDTKEGTIMRERITPKNPRSAAQLAVRVAFTKATKQWSTLTAAQLVAWENFADTYTNEEETTEKRYNSSGFNAWVKLAAKWYAVNSTGTAPTTPPASSFSGDDIKITATAVTGGIKFTATAANSSNVVTALLVAKLGGKNRKASAGQFREKMYFNFKPGTLETTVSLPVGYYAAGYSFVNTTTGQESQSYILGNVGPVGLSLSDSGSMSKKKAA